jgi:hypothetical protein
MSTDTSAAILRGIRAYLWTHFPDVAFTAQDNDKTRSVVFHADGKPPYRLEITERFLEAEIGVARTLARLQEWEVAKVLREAKSKLVTVATTGLHTSDHRWALPARRR